MKMTNDFQYFKTSGAAMISFVEYGMMAIFDLAMLCYAGEIIKAEVSFGWL